MVLEPSVQRRVGDRQAVSPAAALPRALVEILRQTAEVIASLSQNDYTAPINGNHSGTIGGHVRHCLDHVSALLLGIETGEIDYDHRERGTPEEKDRHKAFAVVQELERQLLDLPQAVLNDPVEVRAMVSTNGPPIDLASNIAREFVFVLSHTIHHNAMIAAAVKARGHSVPDGFGYAPSTLAYMT